MAMAVAIKRRRFTADEYQQMARAGILREGDPFELIDGEVVRKMTIGPRHVAVVTRLTRHFILSCRDAAIVHCQGPVSLDLFNEPEPDLALLRRRPDYYRSAHPGPADILLVVEVAQTSIDYDRTVKAELYARLGVVEYWLVDLNVDVVTRYTEPADGQYRRVEPMPVGATFAPRLLPACTVTTDAIFG
jgi:Uma2 family endonuclease